LAALSNSTRITSDFNTLLQFKIERTEAYYRDARIGVRRLRTGRVGVMAGLEVYRAILPSIRRNSYDVFARRAGTTKPRKSSWRSARRSRLRKYHGQRFFGVLRNRHHSPSDS
jgi:phytoene/squalene synthetase